MLRADPRLRFGVLANGLHYIIMRNATPKGQAALRLRIGSGSLEETDAQQGLAHFLEHMAFKGSTHVPNGDMIKILERQGLAFGPDTNAFTAQTQTVYMLDVPETQGEGLDVALMLLRETGGELLMSNGALEPERGVVLSEERLRDTPEYRAYKAKLELQLEGRLAGRRFPIGVPEVIRTAPSQRLKDFYDANYRPERATVVAVGDFDPDVMEAKIKARFSDWRAKGAAAAEPDLGALKPSGLKTQLLIIPGANTEIDLTYLRPYDSTPDSVARRRRDTIEQLALAVLNRRLEKLARAENPAFVAGSAENGQQLRSLNLTQVRAVTSPDRWKAALFALEQETRRLAQYGVSDEELQREVIDYRTQLENAVAGESTRRTPSLADDLVESVDETQVFTAPADDLALFNATVKDLSKAEVDAAAKHLLSGSGPMLQVSAPQPLDGGEAALAVAFQQSAATPLSAPTVAARLSWPYADFGPKGTIAQKDEVKDLGLKTYRFANGVQLVVKQNAFQRDQIEVQVRLGDGRRALPRDASPPTWAEQAVSLGGLGKIGFEDMEQVLNGRTYGARATFSDRGVYLRGTTRGADLDTQLQVLAAYATDAAFRPAAFERLRAAMANALRQFDATAMGVFERDGQALITDGDHRFDYPASAELAAAKPSDLKALFEPQLQKGAVEIIIAGDVDPDRAAEAVAATFGALPARTPSPSAPTPVHFHAPGLTTETHHGRADQAAVLVGYPIVDFIGDAQKARDAIIMEEVLKDRLLDQVRVAEGSTYSPEGQAAPSETFPGFGYVINMVETPPDRVERFRTNVRTLAEALKAAPPTADEVLRAVKPRQEQILKAQQSNEYWLVRLDGSTVDPKRLDIIRTSISGYAAVTPDRVQAAAKAYLDESKAWTLVILPAEKK